jgi:hypothetical protein
MIQKFGERFPNINEAKNPDIVIPANDANDLDEEAVYFKSMLKKAGVDARCEAGVGDVEIYLENKRDLKKAQKVIDENGYQYESAVQEAAGTVSKELMKATDKFHAEQIKLQDIQKKFVTETDPAKKEKLKKEVIAQHKIVKKAEDDFQTTLGREDIDYDDEMFEGIRKAVPVGEYVAISDTIEELFDRLTEVGIDDIITELEVAGDDLQPTNQARKLIKKDIELLVDTYKNLIVNIVRAGKGIENASK